MTVCTEVGKGVPNQITISKGLKQECSVVPTMFKAYLNKALMSWWKKCNTGIPTGDRRLFTLHSTDYHTILALHEMDICYMLSLSLIHI